MSNLCSKPNQCRTKRRTKKAAGKARVENVAVVVIRYGAGKRLVIFAATSPNDFRMQGRDACKQTTSALGLSFEDSVDSGLRRFKLSRERRLTAAFHRFDLTKHR